MKNKIKIDLYSQRGFCAGVDRAIEIVNKDLDKYVKDVKEKNLIKIKTKKIKVDLKLNLFGKKVKLATIDLSKYYNPTFEFPGPILNQKSIKIDKPDGSEKTLKIGMENQNLVVENGKITVYSDVKFSELSHDEKHPERNKN